jgi:hypothetical protein
MRSWHDFNIIGYTVDGKFRSLTFDIEGPADSYPDVRRAEIRFTDVECYYLEHDLGVSIVLAFEEVALEEHLAEWAERFETESKWGWPRFWRAKPYPPRHVREELEDSLAVLRSKEVRCFHLSSSYGLSGWILAAGVEDVIIEG